MFIRIVKEVKDKIKKKELVIVEMVKDICYKLVVVVFYVVSLVFGIIWVF